MEKSTLAALISDQNINIELIKSWISTERDFWVNLINALGTYPTPYPAGVLQEYVSSLSEIRKALSLTSSLFDPYKIHSIISFSRDNSIPNHDHKAGQLILQNLENKELLSSILFSQKVSNDSFENFFEGNATTKYKELLDTKIAEFLSTKNDFTSQTEALLRTLKSREEAYTQELQETQNLAYKKLAEDADEHSKKISEVSSLIHKDILSNQPVTFWQSKEERHREQAGRYQKWALVLGLLASLVLLSLILAAFKDQDTTTLLGFKLPNHFYIAALILIGSAFVWTLRVCIQLMMTHMTLESEALERVTAIKTYVALSRLGVTPEIEKEFHKAILSFQRVKISEDSGHPELINIIENLISKSKSS